MTEKTGGSDVGNSETVATKNKDGTYSIHGYKFFTSASTSQMTVLLARTKDEKGNVIPVCLFLITLILIFIFILILIEMIGK